MRAVTGFFGGLIPAYLGSQIASMVLRDQAITIPFLLLWAIGFAIAFKAKTVAKAWRWLLLLSALFAFALPIAFRMFPPEQSSFSPETSAEAIGGTMGRTLGSVLAHYIASVCGVVMGVVFLVVGLLVGRDKLQDSSKDPNLSCNKDIAE